MPTFSIVVPVYNAQAYIEECLQSLADQTYKDFEVIIVDDGSADSSLSVCQQAVESLGIKSLVISQENKGPLLARRRGVDASSGEYVLFVDSDDVLAHTALEEMADCLQEHPVDILFFNASRTISFSPVPSLDYPYSPHKNIDKESVLKVFCSTNLHNALWRRVTRKTVLDAQFEDDFYEGIKTGEDYLQTALDFDKATSFVYLDKTLYCHRKVPKTFHIDMFRDDIRVFTEVEQYVQKWAKDYNESSFISLLSAGMLNTYSSHACSASLVDNVSVRRDYLEEICSAKVFLDAAQCPGAYGQCRADTRIVMMLLKKRLYGLLRLVAHFRNGIKRMRDS